MLTLAIVMAFMALGVSTAAAGGYELVDTDGLEGKSADGKAKASGQIKWYTSNGFTQRGDYTPNAKIRAIKPVGCIWVKVTYGFPNGSVTVGQSGIGGGVSGGSYDATQGFYVSCRRPGHRRPTRLSLAPVGYAKGLLNSSTLQICTSRNRRGSPGYCGFEKNSYLKN